MGNRGKKARENRPTGMIAVTGKKARAGGRKEKKDSIELVCQLNVIDTGAIEKSKKREREGEEMSSGDILPEMALLIPS